MLVPLLHGMCGTLHESRPSTCGGVGQAAPSPLTQTLSFSQGRASGCMRGRAFLKLMPAMLLVLDLCAVDCPAMTRPERSWTVAIVRILLASAVGIEGLSVLNAWRTSAAERSSLTYLSDRDQAFIRMVCSAWANTRPVQTKSESIPGQPFSCLTLQPSQTAKIEYF